MKKKLDVLSEKAHQKIEGWQQTSHERVVRPHWDNYFLAQAFLAAQRSHDANTKNGAVIVDTSNKVIGQGYNGLPRNVEDSFLPNKRGPNLDKYSWMIHAELNAILNCTVSPVDARIYITGPPCLHCALCIWQAGINCMIYTEKNKADMLKNDEYDTNMNIFFWLTGMQRIVLNPDFSFMNNLQKI